MFTYISPAIRNVSGYEVEDLVGKMFLKLVHPEDIDLLMKRFSELTGGAEYPLEYRIMGKSGEVRHVRTYTKPIMKENTFEEPGGLSLTSPNASELRRPYKKVKKNLAKHFS